MPRERAAKNKITIFQNANIFNESIILSPMFDDIKKIQELKRMQDSMKLEKETAQKRGITVTVNGNMEIENITLNPALEQRETETALKECINDAMKAIQKRMAKVLIIFERIPLPSPYPSSSLKKSGDGRIRC